MQLFSIKPQFMVIMSVKLQKEHYESSSWLKRYIPGLLKSTTALSEERT